MSSLSSDFDYVWTQRGMQFTSVLGELQIQSSKFGVNNVLFNDLNV